MKVPKIVAVLVIMMWAVVSNGADCYWWYPPSGPAEYVCPQPDYYQTMYFEPDPADYNLNDQIYHNLQADEWYVVPSGIILQTAPFTYYCYGHRTAQQTFGYTMCTFIP